MAEPKPFRERPVLLVDLSEKVSEDLRINTPRSLAPIPSLKAAAAPKAAGLKASSLAFAGLGSAGALTLARTEKARRVVRKPPPALVQALRAKIHALVPGDGVLILSLIMPDLIPKAGETWVNHNDSRFWIAAEHTLDHEIDMWMGEEFQHISDNLAYDFGDQALEWGAPGHRLNPDLTTVEDAWNEVCINHDETEFVVPLVREADDVVVDEVTITAKQLMDFYGLDRGAIEPIIVVADAVTPEDMAALEAHDDEEVHLDGYVVAKVEYDEFATIHIVPSQ